MGRRGWWGDRCGVSDEGNTVCFSQKWGRFIENNRTGERIYFERKNNTYVMKLKVKKEAKTNGQTKASPEKKSDGMYKRTEEMERGANDVMDDDEEMARRFENGFKIRWFSGDECWTERVPGRQHGAAL